MERRTRRTALGLISLLSALAAFAAAGRGRAVQDPAPPVLALASDAKELALTRGLAVGLVGQYGRYAVPSDLLAWQMATGAMAEPRAGGRAASSISTAGSPASTAALAQGTK